MDGGVCMRPTEKYVVAGILAGILNGLFGAGGGLILVPLLTGWIGLEQKRAFATSVAIILPLSIVSYTLFCLQGGNVWEEALPYLLGGVIGGLISAKLFQNVSVRWLHRLFALLLFYGGVKAVLGL